MDRAAMSVSRREFLGAVGAATAVGAFPTGAHAQTQKYEMVPTANGQALTDPGGRVVLAYLTSKPEGLAGNSACCIHPLHTLGGARVTDLAPQDHRDHRGIFFAWHNVEFKKGNDVLKGDFWGWGRFAPVEERVIVNRDLRLVRADARTAEIEVLNDWTIAGTPVMRETTTIVAGQEQGARVLDLSFRFSSADYDVTINQMAFTGFTFRCRKGEAYTFFDSEGEVTPQRLANSSATQPETDWPARPWYAHQVTMPDGQIVSAAVIDHPGNPRSLWHGARSVSFLNPCVTAVEPVRIPRGNALTLRYRAVARDGAVPIATLDNMAARWRTRG
jgi:hypothetical protein